jgi:gamma-glutamylputrescine oxidase
MIEPMYCERTWYEATADRGTPPSVSGAIDADVCVIGGGLAGLTTALELARRGTSVVLLEGRRIAWGASGRNGGFVSNGFAEGMENVAARVGLAEAQALYQLSCFGTEFVRREIAEGDPSIKMGEGWQGCIRYSQFREEKRRRRGDGAALWPGDAVPRRCRNAGPGRKRSAISSRPTIQRLPHAPAALCADDRGEGGGRGCAAVRECRLRFRRKARCGACGADGGGRGEGRDVVYLRLLPRSRLHPMTGRAVLPVATYVAVTEPLQQDVIRTRSAISDSRRAGNYFRLIDEGRLLWGGAITTRVSEPRRLAERMKRDMVSVFPNSAIRGSTMPGRGSWAMRAISCR